MNQMYIPRSLYREIMTTIGTEPTESGGIFAVKDNTVSDYYFDVEAGTGKRYYQPTALRVEEKVNRWLQEGKVFGYIHSHRPGLPQLSFMDLLCAQMNNRCNDLPFIYMAVVCDGQINLYKVAASQTEEQGEPEVYSLVLREDDHCHEERRIPDWFSDAVRRKMDTLRKERA